MTNKNKINIINKDNIDNENNIACCNIKKIMYCYSYGFMNTNILKIKKVIFTNNKIEFNITPLDDTGKFNCNIKASYNPNNNIFDDYKFAFQHLKESAFECMIHNDTKNNDRVFLDFVPSSLKIDFGSGNKVDFYILEGTEFEEEIINIINKYIPLNIIEEFNEE